MHKLYDFQGMLKASGIFIPFVRHMPVQNAQKERKKLVK